MLRYLFLNEMIHVISLDCETTKFLSKVNNSLSPRLYTVNQLDETRNQVDIGCQTYLTSNDLTAEDRMKKGPSSSKKRWSKSWTCSKQDVCLSNLKSLQIDQTELEDLEQCLKTLKLDESEAILKVEKDLDCALFQRQNMLFMSQRIIFLNKSYCEMLFKGDQDKSITILKEAE